MAAFPSLSKVTTQLMSYTLLVNGAAIDASASDKEIPTAAVLSAPQSLAPSPHIPTCIYSLSCIVSTSSALSSGDILAKTWHLESTELNTYGFYSLRSARILKAFPVIPIPISVS